MKDPMFDEAQSEFELSMWQLLKSLVTIFLGNHWSVEYNKEIEELKCFCQLEAWMSVKLYFLQSLLDYFPKNCGDLSGEQGECFHQDIRIIKERCQGLWDVNFLADYCWFLEQDIVAAKPRRMSLKRPFIYK